MGEVKTLGIPPAKQGALQILQFTPAKMGGGDILQAAQDVIGYKKPTEDQAVRHKELAEAAAFFLTALVHACPPGPERSTAISRLREAKMWASAAVALEGI